MTRARRTALGAVLVVALVAVAAACTPARRPGPGTERHPLPRLPELGTSEVPAVGVLRFDAARGLVVGLWAKADVYALDEAVAVAQRVAASVGVSPP